MFDSKEYIELRVLGSQGKPYVDLENKYTVLFEDYGIDFGVPRLFSAPQKTSVAVVISIGILTGAGIHLVEKLIDEIFSIQKNQLNTEIHINIQNGDNYMFIEGEKSEIIHKLKEIKEQHVL